MSDCYSLQCKLLLVSSDVSLQSCAGHYGKANTLIKAQRLGSSAGYLLLESQHPIHSTD